MARLCSTLTDQGSRIHVCVLSFLKLYDPADADPLAEVSKKVEKVENLIYVRLFSSIVSLTIAKKEYMKG